jgi:lipid II isoglutaminyl synthase (glutamine-hydrolysing)
VLAVSQQLGLDITKVAERLVEVKPAFGRGETIEFGDRTIILQLVKNPGGFRHALLSGKHHNAKLTAIAINDDYADGRDISWLWDVDFEGVLRGEVCTTGTRAYDMALRLKYDDIKTSKINQSLKETLSYILNKLEPNETALIYTTYTAMLALRKLMAEKTKVESI